MSSRQRLTSRTSKAPTIAHVRFRPASRTEKQLAAVRHWREYRRPALLRSVAKKTELLRWSTRLIEVLLDEMHVDDELEQLLGEPLRDVSRSRFPQAIAIGLVLRHSWRADDFAETVDRLGLVRKER